MNNTNLYRVDGFIQGTNNDPAIAHCDVGDLVLNGGFRVISKGDSPISTLHFNPGASGTVPNRELFVVLQSENPNDNLVYTAFAVCFDNPPLR